MSLELELVSPPEGWTAGYQSVASSEDALLPDLTVEQFDGLVEEVREGVRSGHGAPVVHLGAAPPWWAQIPPGVHLHLTAAAVDVVLDAMAALGMLTHSILLSEAFVALDAEAHARFVRADSEATGIPSYKLYADHRWVITPREIHLALATYAAASDPEATVERLLGPESLPLWKRWLDYLHLASAHGGFCVAGGSLRDPNLAGSEEVHASCQQAASASRGERR